MQTSQSMNRRRFCQLAGGTVAYLAGGSLVFGSTLPAFLEKSLAAKLTPDLPRFDGTFVFDAEACRAMADDFGHHVHRLPIGVLEPRSAADISKALGYARKIGVKVAVRGLAGSAYGQTQVEGGIVINTANWRGLQWASHDEVDALPGTTWHEVVDFTWPRGLTPPVLPDTLFLTVGGTLSVGGIGESSYRFGPAVAHVTELDLVTASGETLTCSELLHRALFLAALGGMGQFGVVTRARLRLVKAPTHVAMREIPCADNRELLETLGRLAEQEPSGSLAGNVSKGEGPWKFSVTASRWINQDAEPAPPAWLAETKGAGAPKVLTYYDFANRKTKAYLDAVKNGSAFVPHPYLSFFLPEDESLAMSEHLTNHPDASFGASAMPIFLVQNVPSRPLAAMPAGTRSWHFRIYRKPKTEGSPEHLKMLQVNQDQFMPQLPKLGGTYYLPHAPIPSPGQVRAHFGKAWEFAQKMKAEADPECLLNPGAGIF